MIGIILFALIFLYLETKRENLISKNLEKCNNIFIVDSKKNEKFMKASQDKEQINKMLSRVDRLRRNKVN